MTQKRKSPQQRPAVVKKAPKCDNCPDQDATFVTTGNGAHQPIHLCSRCDWR